MKKKDSDQPLPLTKERRNQENLTELGRKLAELDLLVLTLDSTGDGQISSVPFYNALEGVFDAYLKLLHMNYDSRRELCSDFFLLLHRYFQEKKLTDWQLGKREVAKVGSYVCGFTTYLGSEHAAHTLAEYYASWRYLIDYTRLQLEFPTLRSPQLRTNTLHPETPIVKRELVTQLEGLVSDIEGEILDVGLLWERVARSSIFLEVSVDGVHRGWYSDKGKVALSRLSQTLGKPFAVPSSYLSPLYKGHYYPEYRTVVQGVPVQVWLKDTASRFSQKALAHVKRDPSLAARLDELLLRSFTHHGSSTLIEDAAITFVDEVEGRR